MATGNNFDTGSDQITQLCIFCDSNVSDGFCGDCEDHMCQPCFDMHTKAKGCRHHVLLNDVSQKDNKKTYTETCKRHLNQSIKFYCVAHKIVGCVECFFPEHRNCNYQNIDDAAKSFQDNCEDIRLKREIHRLENTHSEYTRQHEEDKETVAVINNTVVNDVKSFTDSVTAYVAQVEKHVLEKSESLHVENKTRLERRFNDLDSVGTEIEKCKVQLEDEDRVNRLFISAIEIGPVIEKLRKKIASIGRQHVVTKYEFQPNKLIMEMVYGSGSFGDVYILPGTTQPTVSTPAGTTQPTVSTPAGTKQSTVSTPVGITQPTVSRYAGTTQSTVSTPAGTTQSTVSTPAGTKQPTVSTTAGTTQSTVSTPAGTTQSTVSTPAGTTLPTVSTPAGTTQSTVSTPAGTTQSTVSTPAGTTQSTVSTHAGTKQPTVSTPVGTKQPTVSTPTRIKQLIVCTRTGTTHPSVSINETVSWQLGASIFPKVTLNDCQKETKNCCEKKNGDFSAEIPLKGSPIAKKKASFQLKRGTGRKFCLIKSGACPKPFKYNPQSEEVYIDEEVNVLYDGDRCFAINVEEGVIKLDEIVDFETINTNPV